MMVYRLLRMRQDWATQLGYENWADMAFRARMATEKQASSLLKALQDASLPAAQKELDELRTLAQQSGRDGEFMAWDEAFWRERLREKQGIPSLDMPHAGLQLPNVLEGLLGLIEKLFGVQLQVADGEAPIWAPGVRFFRVVDQSSGFAVGGLYMDLFKAERKTRGGFWTDVAMRYSRQLGTKRLSRRPVVQIVGDVAQAAEGEEANLSLAQVQGLFRAMGAALQELLTDQEEGLMAGSRGVEIDAVGLPGRLLEMFALEPSVLESFGLTSGEAAAAALAGTFHSGAQTAEEVRLARVDLELHSSFDIQRESPFDIASRIAAETVPTLPGAEDHTPCAFESSLSSGHPAGQYADLWAQVLAADVFEAFQEVGLSDARAVRDLGLRFRASILAPGGGRAPLDAFREFRGRIPRVAALLRRRGLRRPQAGGDGVVGSAR
mmetsp:Transcript_62519/g.158958  ORF Transcript_62519/g.158958 Transcript_62519/m.158958 type:complete len:437 (+) Transcript_62519:220-1530(+)